MASIDTIGAGAAAPDTGTPKGNPKLYFAAWRWHFYAGIFVIPFLLVLTVTGMVMMLNSGVSNQLGYAPNVTIGDTQLSPSAMARAVLATAPDASVDQYVAPEAPNRPAYIRIKDNGASIAVAVDPYKGDILARNNTSSTLYAIANDIHGELLLGKTGDRIMETAASLTVLLIVSGLWLWWPRNRSVGSAFLPRLSLRGRGFWKELHMVGGVWVSLFLLLFCLSGLAWSGVWGGKFVQPWSSFPAEKSASGWSSDLTHKSLNHGPLDEVPWGIELTPMPVSGTENGTPAIAGPVTLDTVVAWAGQNGFDGQYKVTLPKGETGVYTVAASSMSEDSNAPSSDRTVHFDQYTGHMLADIGYGDYSVMAKGMAQGIALHKGLAGTWNFVLNLGLLLLIMSTCVTGVVMWWKRRPSGIARLAAPPMPAELPFWRGATLAALAVALAFPMAGIAILAVIAVDIAVVSKIGWLKRAVS